LYKKVLPSIRIWMSEEFTTGMESISSSLDSFDWIMNILTDTMNLLAVVFERTAENVVEFWVKVAKKVKDMWIKFLKEFWFIDKELFQLIYIKNHLRNIKTAVDNNDTTLISWWAKIIWWLNQVRDMFVQRLNTDNSYYNNLGFAVVEIKPMIDDIVSKIPLK